MIYGLESIHYAFKYVRSRQKLWYVYFCVALDLGLYWYLEWGGAGAALSFSECPR